MFVPGYLPSVLPLYLILFDIGIHCSLKPGKKGVSGVVSFLCIELKYLLGNCCFSTLLLKLSNDVLSIFFSSKQNGMNMDIII